jgi:hypothetical protein
MRLAFRPVESMQVVIVVSVGVIVFYSLMRVVMVMPLRQMQP